VRFEEDSGMRGRTMMRLAVAGLMILAARTPARAQVADGSGRRASFTAGASLGDGDTALALSAALGFRIASRASLEFAIDYARRLDFTLDLCPAPRVCVVGGTRPVTGRTVSIAPHLVIELLAPSRRVRAYAAAGVGGGHVRQRYFTSPIETGELTRSSVVVAVSFGGGASMRISRQLAIGADVRVLSLLDEESPVDRFIQPSGVLRSIRLGSRVSWEF
jgi:hypothetical protein